MTMHKSARHQFGKLLQSHLEHRGLSQASLAAGVGQEPTIISKMCRGQRLTGAQARERVLAIIRWLHSKRVLDSVAEANALLAAAGLAPLRETDPAESKLLAALSSVNDARIERLSSPASGVVQTQLIGRETVIAQILSFLMEQNIQLVTLTGPPGVGKTSLALEIANLVAPHYCVGYTRHPRRFQAASR